MIFQDQATCLRPRNGLHLPRLQRADALLDLRTPGGFNIAVRGIGHCAMLLSRRVGDLLVENLSSARSETA